MKWMQGKAEGCVERKGTLRGRAERKSTRVEGKGGAKVGDERVGEEKAPT